MNVLIEKWMREKPFEELNDAERRRVLEEMSEEEYTQIRAILRTAPSLDAALAVPDRVRQQLLLEQTKRRGPRPPRRIPLSWAATLALLLAACVYWLKPAETAVVWVDKPVERWLVRTDTMWLTRTELRWRTIRHVKPEEEQTSDIRLPVSRADTAMPFSVVWEVPLDSVYWNTGAEPVNGTPIGAAPELWQFLGSK